MEFRALWPGLVALQNTTHNSQRLAPQLPGKRAREASPAAGCRQGLPKPVRPVGLSLSRRHIYVLVPENVFRVSSSLAGQRERQACCPLVLGQGPAPQGAQPAPLPVLSRLPSDPVQAPTLEAAVMRGRRETMASRGPSSWDSRPAGGRGFWSDVALTWNAPALFREGRHPMETMKWKRKQPEQTLQPGFCQTSPTWPWQPWKPKAGRRALRPWACTLPAGNVQDVEKP